MVDLRSDTVTLPTPEMRRAMAEAELGDDVYGEDPTVNRLEERAAELLGKEAAVFVASGTMGNRLGLLCNARYGDAVIADARSHLFLYEAGGGATVGGMQVLPLETDRGVLTADQVVGALSPDDPHYAPTTAVSIENTHNRHGGVAWPPEAVRELCEAARAHGLRVHVDGARIFNAAVATGMPAAELVAGADTVTFCLSKGLACPVGSVFCGSAEDVHEARRWRKMLGGGMRQAGILAAAGLVALDSMIDRLAEDHANARLLAESLAEMPGATVDLDRVQTNFVFVAMAEPDEFVAGLKARGVLAGTAGPGTVRLATHYGIDAEDIQRAIAACNEVLGQ